MRLFVVINGTSKFAYADGDLKAYKLAETVEMVRSAGGDIHATSPLDLAILTLRAGGSKTGSR